MRAVVCGGRDYDNAGHVNRVLWEKLICKSDRDDLCLILGGARGADELARQWAMKEQIPHMIYPAEWKRYGRAAGMRRNRRMLKQGKPDLVIAFPGGYGTRGMVAIARDAGVEVIEVMRPMEDML